MEDSCIGNRIKILHIVLFASVFMFYSACIDLNSNDNGQDDDRSFTLYPIGKVVKDKGHTYIEIFDNTPVLDLKN